MAASPSGSSCRQWKNILLLVISVSFALHLVALDFTIRHPSGSSPTSVPVSWTTNLSSGEVEARSRFKIGRGNSSFKLYTGSSGRCGSVGSGDDRGGGKIIFISS